MPRPNPDRTIGQEAVLARRIAHERDRHGLSYDALAEKMSDAGCPIQGSAIYKIVNGDPPRRVTVDEAAALALVFDVGIEDLLTPLELIRKRQARELIEQVEPIRRSFIDMFERLVRLQTDVIVLGHDDAELGEYVVNHWASGAIDPESDGDDRVHNTAQVMVSGLLTAAYKIAVEKTYEHEGDEA